MRRQKQLYGFIVFMSILTSVVFIYDYINWPPWKSHRAKAPVSAPELPANPPSEAADELLPVNYDVRLVSLDFINGKSYTTLALKLPPGQPAPDKLLVKTRFYLPGRADNPAWTGVVGITRQSEWSGDPVEVTVTSTCDWCARPDTPKAGYFADVYVSAQYEGKDYPPSSYVTPVETAVPVVVQAERKARR